MSQDLSRANYGWLRLGAILVLLLADLQTASLLCSRTMSELSVAAGLMVFGLLKAATTVIGYAFASVLLLVQ